MALNKSRLSSFLVLAEILLAFMLFANPIGPFSPSASAVGQGQFQAPVGPLSPPPVFSTTTTIPQTITLSEAESQYCTSCKTYPDLYGIVNDFYEAKVQPNGWGTTWYIHFPTTNGVVVGTANSIKGLYTTQTVTNANLTISLYNDLPSTKFPLADRLALVYFFDSVSGYQEIDVDNLTALVKGSGGTMSLEYSNVVQTGDVFQFVPFPNGALPASPAPATILGNCTTGKPTCLYSYGYSDFGEASLTRTCAPYSSTTTSYTGTVKETASRTPSPDCAVGLSCSAHSTTSTITSSTTVLKSETCDITYSTVCSTTNTSTTFATTAKLPPCDESNWTAASVLHSWGDTDPPGSGGYQSIEALENSWEIVASSSGIPKIAIALDDFTTEYGNRSQTGVLEWLDTYTQEYLGYNTGKATFYSIEASVSTSCHSFAFSIPTTRGTLAGTIKITPYIGTGCSASNHNPFVASLSGSLTLTTTSGSTVYTVSGVSVEFGCNVNELSNCSLPVTTTTSISCEPLVAGQPSTCEASVTDSGSTIAPTGTINFSSNDTQSLSSTSCKLPAVTTTSDSASCSITFTPQAAGHADVTAAYAPDSEEVHLASSGQDNILVT